MSLLAIKSIDNMKDNFSIAVICYPKLVRGRL